MLDRAEFAASIQEAAQNYEDNQLHEQLEDTDYSLGVYRQSDGTRRYELSLYADQGNPVLVTTSRDDISTYINSRIL